MLKEFQAAYEEVEATHASILTTLREQLSTVRAADKEETADAVYALREISKLADDLRKACDKLRTVLEKQACMLWAQSGDDEPIRTWHCSGTPNIKEAPMVPHYERDREQYVELMEYFGVTYEQHGRLLDAGVLQLHYKQMTDYLTELALDGLPLPPGLKGTYKEFSLTVRSKHPVANSENEA